MIVKCIFKHKIKIATLSNFVKLMMFCLFSDPDEIWIVQVSFDENNGNDPKNLMDRDTFEYAKADRLENIVWFINIVYKTNFEFSTCDINTRAADQLKSHVATFKRRP